MTIIHPIPRQSAFNPADYGKLFAWYNPDTEKEADEAIVIPQDQSPNKNHGQVKSGHEPILLSGEINNNKAYKFRGDHWFDTQFYPSGESALIFVIKWNGDAGNRTHLGHIDLQTNTNISIHGPWFGEENFFVILNGDQPGGVYPMKLGKSYVVTLINRHSGFQCFINNKLIGSGPFQTISSEWRIGHGTFVGGGSTCSFGDILLFEELSEEGRYLIEQELGRKAGLAISVKLWNDLIKPIEGEASIVRYGPPGIVNPVSRFVDPTKAINYIPPGWPSNFTLHQGSDQTIYDLRGEEVGGWKAYFDNDHLFIRITQINVTGLYRPNVIPINSADNIEDLFKGGDSASICIGTVGGNGINQRFVFAKNNGKDKVLRMAPVWTYGQGSPHTYNTRAVGDTVFEEVSEVTGTVHFVLSNGYPFGVFFYNIAIPWKILHLDPNDIQTQSIPLDVEIIKGDQSGNINIENIWWKSVGAGPNAIWDASAESRLYPTLWGVARLWNTDPDTHTTIPTSNNEVINGPGVPINFSVTGNPKRVSINIVAKTGNSIGLPDGWVVDELLRAVFYPVGNHTIYWGGRGHNRWIMPSGNHYEVMIGMSDSGITTTYLASFGTRAEPPYRTVDGLGSIGGIHNGPWHISSDSQAVIVSNGGQEGQKAIRKVLPTGRAIWFNGSVGNFGIGFSSCSDGTTAYILTSLMRFTALDAVTGDNLWELSVANIYDLTVSNIGEAMVVLGGYVYFTRSATNSIGRLNTLTHLLESDIPLGTGKVASGMCIFDSTHLLTCINDEIIKLTIADGTQVAVITGLDNPKAITKDGSDNYYVSDAGTNQIYQYNSSFVLTNTYGILGGSDPNHQGSPPTQDFVPEKWANIYSIAIGPDGHLWCCGRTITPRRVFSLNVTTGLVVQEYGGPHGFSTLGFDLDDMTQVFMGGAFTSFVRISLDYAGYAADPESALTSWTIEELLLLSQNGQDFTASPDLFTPLVVPNYRRLWVFTCESGNPNSNGKRYMMLEADYKMLLWVRDGTIWKSAAIIHLGKDTTYTTFGNEWYDNNGNGLVDVGEQFYNEHPIRKMTAIQKDLTLIGTNGKLVPSSINAYGVPIYTDGIFTPHLDTDDIRRYGGEDWSGIDALMLGPGPTDDDSIIVISNYGPEGKRNFHDDCSAADLIKMENGKVTAIFGRYDPFFRNNADATASIQGIAGTVDGVIIIADFNNKYRAYTTSGLALGEVAYGQTGPTAIYIENACNGQFIKDPKTGKRILLATTTEDNRVFEIGGVFDGDLTITNIPINLNEVYPLSSNNYDRPLILYNTWGFPISGSPYQVGCGDFDWHWASSVSRWFIRNESGPVCEVRLRTDAGQLCGYIVTLDNGPFPNSGDPQANIENIFGAQAGFELCLGTMDNPNRTTPQQGDTRIFITVLGSPSTTGKYRSAGSSTLQNSGAVVVMCRPNSDPIAPNSHMRASSDFYHHPDGWPAIGTYAGIIPSSDMDFTTPTEVPNSWVYGWRRHDKLGWIIQFEIPLAFLPDFCQLTERTYIRPSNHSSSDTRPDIIGDEIKCNMAFWKGNGDGTATRTSWENDNFKGTDMALMNPSLWGIANGNATLISN